MRLDTKENPKRRRACGRARIAAMVAVVGLMGVQAPRAYALDDTVFDEFRRLDQRQEQERRERERAPNVPPQTPVRKPPPMEVPQEHPCFTLQSIHLDGNDAKQFPWAQPLVDPYVGWCIGRVGINLLVKRLQQEFLVRGWVTTRVVVPPQDLAGATLTLKVVPGLIREIRFADAATRGSWATAFPARPGELLNLRDLEQGLEQLKRVPSQDVNMEIVPGQRPGESDIVIQRQLATPWRVFVTMDDSGSDATGKYQGSTALAVDGIFGINDLFSATYNRGLSGYSAHSGTRAGSLYYSWPYGYWTFSLGGNENSYQQTIQGTNQNFILSGEARQYDARVHRIVHRSQSAKTGVQVRVIKRRLRNYIQDAELRPSSRAVSLLEPGINHHRYIGKSEFDVQLARPMAVSWFGATPDPVDAGPDTPTNRYRLWTLDAHLSVPFTLAGREVRYSALLHAQTSSDPLYGTELIGIGNRYTVRGFDGEHTLAAERGGYLRNEMAVPMAGSQQQLYLGVDHGEVSGASADLLPGRRLTGAVLGLRGAWRGFTYDAYTGRPLSKPAGFATDNSTWGFMLTYQF